MPPAPSDILHRALASGDPDVWAAARERMGKLDLSGADLAGKTLADFDLSGVDLTNADLSEADLTGAQLDAARLDGVDLTDAKLLEIEVEGASFAGAALDGARVAGAFVGCDFSASTWENAIVRGSRFVRCDFDGAEIDVVKFARANRFDQCNFGEREDVPASLRVAMPDFLRPPLLEDERVVVSKLVLEFASEHALRSAVIGAATDAGWEPEMVAFLREGARLYVGLRPEEHLDELEEWLAFEEQKGRLAAVEIVIDPSFDSFLEEFVLPIFELARGDLVLTIEQDLGEGSVGVTELEVVAGTLRPPRQFQRRAR